LSPTPAAQTLVVFDEDPSEHRSWVRPREPVAPQNLERDLGVLARNIGIAVAVDGRVSRSP
jgi:hypothetical protein